MNGSLTCSYVEVYNEGVFDLLNKREKVGLRDDSHQGVILIGSTEVPVACALDVCVMLLWIKIDQTSCVLRAITLFIC